MSALFRPTKVGAMTLPNRVAVAPMTRSRADENGVPSPLAATYYGERFVANPDLVEGLRSDAPLADADDATFYTPGPAGYVDYPTLG